MIEIYKTNNMEAAIHAMAERNKCVMVYERLSPYCKRRIRIRNGLMKDLEPKLVRGWDSFAPMQIADWRDKGGVMMFRDSNIVKNPPPTCESVLITEMPIFPEDFYRLCDLATKELIVFVPPDWSMHEEELNVRYPLSDAVVRLRTEIDGLRDYEPMIPQKVAVLKYSRCDPKTTAVFFSKQIEELAEVPEGSFKRIFMKKRVYSRFECYRPMMPPTDDGLLQVYQELEKCENLGNGLRALRNGIISSIPKARIDHKLKILKRAKNIIKYDDVYLVEKPLKPVNFDMHDAEQGVIRKQHYKLREFMDDKPFYPLIKEQK